MRLSDIVSAAGLSTFAEVALVIFMITFAGIVLYVFRRSAKQRYDRARYLPLEEEPPAAGPRTREEGAAP